MRLTDTHCHLDLDRFDQDRDQVIERALAAGLERLLIPAIHLESARRIQRLVRQHPTIYGAVGIHPLDATSWNESSSDEIRDIIQQDRQHFMQNKFVAIGEIGLDHYWQEVPHDVQEHALHEQLELASELNLPVIIHMREKGDQPEGSCYEKLGPILSAWTQKLHVNKSPLANRPGVLHSFSGSVHVAQEVLNLGFYIGMTGPITYKNASLKIEVVKSLPLDKILIETDSPFLSPMPFRGKRNEPAYVQYISEKIAKILDLNPQKAAQITAENAARLFAWEADL